MSLISQFSTHLALQPAVLVTVDATEGSAPRERGAWMAVFPDRIVGTIGGGHLEFKAIARAREFLLSELGGNPPAPMRVALGPSLGQCCGGVVWLRFEAVAAADTVRVRCANCWPPCVATCRWRCLAAAMWAGRWSRCWAACRFACTGSTAATRFSPTTARQRALRAFRPGARRRGRAGAGSPRADHELQPCRGPGRGGRLPEAPARARRPALRRPDRQQDQMGHLPPPAGGARLSAPTNWRTSPARSACPASAARSPR